MAPPVIHHPPPPSSPLDVSCLSAIEPPFHPRIFPIRWKTNLLPSPPSILLPGINTEPGLSAFGFNAELASSPFNPFDILSTVLSEMDRGKQMTDPSISRKIPLPLELVKVLPFENKRRKLRCCSIAQRVFDGPRWTTRRRDDNQGGRGLGSGIVCGGRDARHREGLLELMATILHSTSLARISTDTNGVSLGAGIGSGDALRQTPGIPRGTARGRGRSFRRNVGVTADFEVASIYTAPRILETR